MMKDLRERAEAVLRDEEQMKRCHNVGWAVETESALNPAWIYQTWDSKEKKQVRSEAAPIKHSEAPLGGPPPGEPSTRGGADEILVPQAPAGEVRCGGHPCDTATEPEGRGERRLQRLHEVAGGTLEAGEDPEASLGHRRPERIHQKPPLPRGSLPEHAVLRLEPAGVSMYTTKLLNHSNVCYINATMQALIWLMEFSEACLGQLQAAARILRSNRGVHLPDCLALRGLFSTWVALHQQHDAGEFLHHCLEYARTEAWLGGWQARLSHPGSIVDSGDLHQAILLHMRGASLQALIDAWRGQYAVHALLLHSGTIFFQVGRYTANADKNRAALRIRPGDSVAVPIFAEPSGTCTRHETFRVVVIVYHLGDRVTSGHYLALLGRPKGSGWEYVVCDDNRAPRRAKKADLDLVDSNWSRALPITAQGPRRVGPQQQPPCSIRATA